MKKDSAPRVLDTARAYDLALNYLSCKNRTEAEMVRYLEKKGCDARTLAAVMARLTRYQLIDDRAYLKNYCYTNVQVNHWGRLKMRYDLKKRGLDPAVLALLDTCYDADAEAACCRRQLEKALRQYSRETGSRRRQKLYTFLQRKGFGHAVIAEALAQAEEALQESGEERAEARARTEEEGLRHLSRYDRMYRRKGYTGRELEQRIFRAMASRGYGYDWVRDRLREKKEADAAQNIEAESFNPC